ncbi:SlyX family protein [Oceanicaulis sp. LC35]|uniref:SlyX family protein n=1 Tax=Oceanicaulis sp. LC35 TaxID=3349635 RepID=UPI003F84B013
MTSDRLDRLEIHVAEQQQMLDDLSEVLTRQTREIEALKARLSQSDTRISELEAGLPAPANEKPPHY